MNLKQAIKWAKEELRGVQEPEKSTEFLLRQVLGWDKAKLIANPDSKLSSKQEKKFREYIERRKKHEPVWYITGKIEFYGLDLEVNENVLIPRPETELLVEEALKYIKNKTKDINFSLSSRVEQSEVERSLKNKRKGFLRSSFQEVGRNDKCMRILELGIGSGAISLALANEFKKGKKRFWTSQNDVKIFASDISGDALKVARRNAKRLKLDKYVEFRRGDLFEPWDGEKFDIIVANLPYIPHEEMDSLAFDIHHWEPRVALDGGKKGLEIYERFMAEAKNYLNDGAMLFLEIGIGQGGKIKKMAKKYLPKVKVQIRKDYSDIDRIAVIRI
jgi:release factor glutamine methyltransferase